MAKDSRQPQDKQAGVTLVLSVLVLAAIAAIAFTMATVLFIEVKVAGNADPTERAVTAAQGLSEVTFFQYKRQVPAGQLNVTNCTPAAANPCTYPGVTLQAAERNYEVTPRLYIVPPQTTTNFLLVDPANPSGFTRYMDSFSITYINTGLTGSLGITVYRCCTAGLETVVTNTSLTSGQNWGYSIPALDTGQYRFTLQNSGVAGSGTMTTSVDVLTASGQHRMPLVGTTAIDITAQIRDLTRKYQIKVPNQ